jgi:hypothetical protein
VTSALTPSRARAREYDEKVVEVLKLMSTGRWADGRSHQELAEKHGVSLEAVQKWANDAGRHLRILQTQDANVLRARNAAHLEAIAVDAHEMDDYSAAIRAREAMAKLLGLNAPEKVQHTVSADLDAMEPLERAAWYEAKAAELLEAAAEERRKAGVVDAKEG